MLSLLGWPFPLTAFFNPVVAGISKHLTMPGKMMPCREQGRPFDPSSDSRVWGHHTKVPFHITFMIASILPHLPPSACNLKASSSAWKAVISASTSRLAASVEGDDTACSDPALSTLCLLALRWFSTPLNFLSELGRPSMLLR